MEQAKDKLVVDNLPLIGYVIKLHFGKAPIEYDDMFQIGCEALVKAAKSFDSNKGNFVTYARACITNDIRYAIRRKNKGIITISLQSDVPDADDVTLADTIKDNSVDIEALMVMRNMLENSDDKTRLVLKLRVRGYSYEQIGDMFGKSKGFAANIVYKFAHDIGYKPSAQSLKKNNWRCDNV